MSRHIRAPRVLAIVGHPNPHSFNGALADAYLDGAAAAGCLVERLDLGALGFDPLLRPGEGEDQPLEPDLVRARAAIEAADHVAWVFPTWWVSGPALVRGFVDRVFTSGWAYRYAGGSSLPEGLLAGRSARMITTMDSPWLWYSLVHGRSVHAAFIRGTLRFVGFGPVRATAIYRLRELDADARARALARVRASGLRDGQRRRLRARAQSRGSSRGEPGTESSLHAGT